MKAPPKTLIKFIKISVELRLLKNLKYLKGNKSTFGKFEEST